MIDQFEPLFDAQGNFLKASTVTRKPRTTGIARTVQRKAHAAVQSFNTIQEEVRQVLLPGILWRKTYTLIAGDPGQGKSVLECDIAARLSCGGKISPYSDKHFDPVNVVIASSEDGPGDTIKPRLRVAGADMARVFNLSGIFDADGNLQHTDMSRHLRQIGECMRDNKASLLILDPVSSFFGRIDSNSQTDVRGVVDPMKTLMEKHDFALLGIMHLNKAGGMNAMYRIGGSIALVGAPRAVFGFARDESQGDNGSRLLLPVKMNLQREEPGYSVQLVDCDGYPKIAWSPERPSIRIDDALGAKAPTQSSRAVQVLTEVMIPGHEVPASTITALCEERGIGTKTWRAALHAIGAKPRKYSATDGTPGRWTWTVPAPPQEGTEQDWTGEPPRGEVLAETIRGPLTAAAQTLKEQAGK